MIMVSFISKLSLSIFVSGMGLLAVGDVPEGWQRSGVAGISLFALVLFMTVTHPRMMRQLMAMHEKSIDKICDRLDKLVGRDEPKRPETK
jgi:hypothetical protein